ncbi:MAG TPA: Hsp33 family molecular chaperone HslO [Steroidobacteraceae bacterium]|jgi:molecular chaperone Hsp33|nr:Hsp33 family molecular chaperone HslO [Steroidobacteraceae bacterium]
MGGRLRRFVLEHHPVRGFCTRLDEPWSELLRLRSYPPAVQVLLGEALTASVLLAATLKFQGTLSLQLEGQGPLRLLLAQCTHDFRVRAVAELREGAWLSAEETASTPQSTTPPAVADAIAETAAFGELVGSGRLAVTVEAHERAARYQGIVALEGGSLAACLESYFASSEQLPTRIALSASATQASGLLVQKMPGAVAQGEALAARSQQAWEEIEHQLSSLPLPMLQSAPAEALLQQLCGRHDVRLFSPTAVRFECRCNWERVTGLLRSLGAEELRSILAEQGAITVTCEFCSRPYRFDAIDVQRLLSSGAAPEAPASMN